MEEPEHLAFAQGAAMEWLLLKIVAASKDPRATLADFRAHMDELAKDAENAADMLLGQNKAEGYVNATTAASKLRELAAEMAGIIIIS